MRIYDFMKIKILPLFTILQKEKIRENKISRTVAELMTGSIINFLVLYA